MLKVRCKNCNAVLESHPIQTRCCGCDNLTTLRGENISGLDLTRIELISNLRGESNSTTLLTQEDIAYHEARRNRKIRKMEFEIR
jgi:hypothetical protein